MIFADEREGTPTVETQTAPRTIDTTKAELMQRFRALLDRMEKHGEEEGATVRSVETMLWKEWVRLGGEVLVWLLMLMCRQKTDALLRALGLTADSPNVLFRFDKNYWSELRTTLGKVVFPLFAFRVKVNGATVTHVPARAQLFPYQRMCRSTELCLEWETRLGADHPFRLAQEELSYFTHDVLHLEDTTIAAHMVKVSQLIERKDLYKSPEQIRDILATQATRDAQTGRPILYLSSDAHALRRYVGETWDAQWKMSNGIRIWCEDRETGRTIHIGGEYTWGDCRQVRQIFQALIETGIVPADGDYGEGVIAQLTWLSDGMPWFEEQILPLFTQLTVILDVYHLLERLAAYVACLYGKNSKKTQQVYTELLALITGRQQIKPRYPKKRKGHKKTPRATHPSRHAHQRLEANADATVDIVSLLLSELAIHSLRTKRQRTAHHKLINYILANGYRMDYTTYRASGYQIGSGAMESMHKHGSQVRLKLPGARWLKDTSQAVVNFRMLKLAGNWDAFWAHPDFATRLAAALADKPPANDNASPAIPSKLAKEAA